VLTPQDQIEQLITTGSVSATGVPKITFTSDMNGYARAKAARSLGTRGISASHQPRDADADLVKNIHRPAHEEQSEDVGCWGNESCYDKNDHDCESAGAAEKRVVNDAEFDQKQHG
jgi:hypothetical protein